MPHHIHPVPFVLSPPADLLQKQPELHRIASQLADLYADGKVVSEHHLQSIGSMLWNALRLPPGALESAQQAAGAAILPVVIHSTLASVQALPWETLYHAVHGFIGKNPAFTLSRQFTAQPAALAPPEKGPLRVLLFTSLPDDLDAEYGRLNVEDEQAQVQEALLPWIAKGKVTLEMPDDGRFSTLRATLKDFQPHVLFLSGHGRFHHAPHTGEASCGKFLFENDIGNAESIPGEQIAGALIGSGVQAVILSACESSKAVNSSSTLNDGLAQRIAAQGIAHVIGMRELILDMVGIAFVRTLCNELARGERIDFALQAARSTLHSVPSTDMAVNRSHGQWCLPMLISTNPQQGLIDWDFPAIVPEGMRAFGEKLGEVTMPVRFIGRRRELRHYKNRLIKGELHKLLITAPGGQGKTSLAGKLACDMKQSGWQVFPWSAHAENRWQEFVFEKMQMELDKVRSEQYDRYEAKILDESKRGRYMLKLLLEQFNGRVVLFLDNLESIQNPDTRVLNDPSVAAWLAAAYATPDLGLLATSRWFLPGHEGEHLALEGASYGDFLRIAQGLRLPTPLFQQQGLHRVYQVLGGNVRGLEFFAAAVKTMRGTENELLEKLAQVSAELQDDMAIEAIVEHLPADARRLLQRLPAYIEAVPLEGLIKLGQDLPEPQALVQELLAFSLLEARYESCWQAQQYCCLPVVADWLRQRDMIDDAQVHLHAVADYHLYLFQYERDTLNQAIATHHALRRAGRHIEADRLTLDAIVGPMIIAGVNTTLLNDWLPRICKAEDAQIRARALGQTGRIHLRLDNYETALGYLKQSLSIRQQIDDKMGQGDILTNISQIFKAQGDYEVALDYLGQALSIQQQIDDKAGKGTTLNNISQIYDAQGKYEMALDYLQESLTIAQQIDDKEGEASALNNISQIFQGQGDYKRALDYLTKSLSIRQQIDDKAGEGTVLNNISQVYQAQGDYETAMGYLKQSLAICQQIGSKAHEAGALSNISQIFHAQGNYETALSYLKKSLAICHQIGNKAGEGITLNNIGQIYNAQGDYKTALNYLKQSLAIQQEIGNKAESCASLFNIGRIHLRNKQMPEALSMLLTAYNIAKEINSAKILQAMSDLASQLGMPQGLEGWEQLAQAGQYVHVHENPP